MMTGAPIGGTTTLGSATTALAKYDPALKRVRNMTPVEQQAFAASQPNGTNPSKLPVQTADDAAMAQQNDPSSAQNVQQEDLSIEHPAFSGLRRATGRRGFLKPKKPGRFR